MSGLAPSVHLTLLRRSRWRVALLGALVVTGVLALLSAGGYVVVRDTLYARLYDRLERAADADEHPGYLVVDERGRPLLEAPPQGGDETREGFHIITDPRLGVLAVLSVQAGGGVLVVATPAQEVSRALAEVLRVLAALTLVGGASALPVGYALAGLALRPLDEAVRERSEFVALASHQLRTPLSVIKTSAELARVGRGVTPAEAIETILQQTQRIEALAARLTALARTERDVTPRPAVADLAAVAEDVASGLAEAARQRGVAIRTDGAPAWIRVDRDEAADMLQAILENAVQYSPPAGTVSVRVSVRGGRAAVEVEDEGPGIPPEELSLVTGPFYQGQRARGGSGLGLAIARAVAERHRGRLEIDSAVGRGTTVRVTLPLQPAPPT